jgi:ABC-type transport system substrate-binding protein
LNFAMMIHIPHSNRRPRARHVQWFIGIFALIATLFAGCAADAGNTARLASNQTLIYGNAGGASLVEPYFDPSDDSKDAGGLSLDPAFTADLYSQTVMNMIQVQLVTFDNSLNIIPDGAASWKKSTDGKTWTFTLQPGMEWSDGTPLTSADFKAGMKHALDPNLCTEASPMVDPDPANQQACPGGQPQSFYLSYIQGAAAYAKGQANDISGIQTPDPQTIVFQLTDPISFVLDDLATAASMPLETSVYNQ